MHLHVSSRCALCLGCLASFFDAWRVLVVAGHRVRPVAADQRPPGFSLTVYRLKWGQESSLPQNQKLGRPCATPIFLRVDLRGTPLEVARVCDINSFRRLTRVSECWNAPLIDFRVLKRIFPSAETSTTGRKNLGPLVARHFPEMVTTPQI